jgi:hypothetical protein
LDIDPIIALMLAILWKGSCGGKPEYQSEDESGVHDGKLDLNQQRLFPLFARPDA